ncbi:MAG: hypothetical protein GY854_18095, partial [Deltaproteobacteria bacterium]|nr:hypothetical protein [Deltaproteobacteria bacterium]
MTRSKIRPIIFTIALVTFLSSNSAAGQPPSSSTNNGVQVVAQDSHSSSIHSVAISKDNRFAFTNSGSETIVWDVESGIAIKKYDTDGATVLRGETAQAYTFRSGGELVVWDLLTGKTLGQTKTGMKRKKYSHDGLSFDILPLGNRVMITRSVLGRHHKKSRQKSRKHTYTLVDINTKKVVKYDDSIACLKSSNLAFTQDETKAFASCGDRLLFWDLESGKKIWEHDLNYNDYFPRYFPRIFPDGKRVVLARKDFIHKPKDLKRALILFDLQKKKVIGTYRMQANIDAIRILSDNRRAAIMHQEGLIQVFDFRLGKVVR